MRTLKLLAAVWVLLCAFSSVSQAEKLPTETGSKAMVCYSADQSIRTVELLDTYEARVLGGLTPSLGGSGVTPIEKASLMIDRLARLAPSNSATYRSWLAQFESELLLLSGADLVDIPDSDEIAVPTGCKIEQLTTQRAPRFPKDKRYTVSKRLWDHLSLDDRAGLMIHELIQREMPSPEAASGITFLVGVLSSGKISSMTALEFLRKASVLRLSKLEVRVDELLIPAESASFYENGQLEYASVRSGSTLRWNGKSYIVENFVSYYPDGVLKDAFLSQIGKCEAGAADAPENGQTLELAIGKVQAYGRVEFHPNGSPSFVGLCDSATVELNGKPFTVRNLLYLYPSGKLQGTNDLMKPYPLPNGFVCSDDSWPNALEFYESGAVLDCNLGNGTEGSPYWGVIRLYENGEVMELNLKTHATFTVQGKKVKAQGSNPVVFYTGNRVKRLVLAEPTVLKLVSGEQRQFLEGDTVEFNEGGLAI